MRIVLKKSEGLDDWYTIVRAERDGREWEERIDPDTTMLMLSERISDACVEGTADEMLAIAKAINDRDAVSFKRCAVRVYDKNAYFRSPRNSREEAEVSLEDADTFAAQVIAELTP